MDVTSTTQNLSDTDLVGLFFRVLCLLVYICPDRLDRVFPEHRQGAHFSYLQSAFELGWSRFLNNLCFLIDFQPGGRTVPSIAVESVPSGPRYYLACNMGPKQSQIDFLRNILECLAQVSRISMHERRELEDQLVREAVARGRKKVGDYRRNLFIYLGRAAAVDNIGKSLQERFSNQNLDDLELSEQAYQIGHDLLKRMPARLSSLGRTRHYIGRLGSWRKAVKQLISFAADNAEVVQDFTVKPIGSNPLISRFSMTEESLIIRPQDIISDTKESVSLARLHLDDLLEENNIRNNAQPWIDGDAVRKARTNAKIHAEVIVAEHFFSHNLEFWEGVRYIGCCKPSCYCCDLYLKFHPGRFVTRKCHGNIWAQWQPPIPDSGTLASGNTHVHQILQTMLKFMKEDVSKYAPARGRQRYMWSPDSTTGITPTISASL